MRHCLLAGMAAVLASGAMAQTYAEFKSAIENASDGDTVWVENDLEYDLALPAITKKITIASPAGQTNVLKRAARMSSTWLSVDASAATADITLRDVIVDGNGEAGASNAMFARMKAGKLTLDAGTTVRNFDWTGRGLGISASAVVDMNEGAVIRDCRYKDWGMFLVGKIDNTSSDWGGTLNMRGGLITGCAGCGGTAENGYDGVLYIYYGGQINMSGGTITGNTSEKATAGVVVYNDSTGGGLYLSGTASVTNNVGGLANDIWVFRSGRIYLAPDYAGRATLWNGANTTTMAEPTLGTSSISGLYRGTGTNTFFSGAGNISCQGHSNVVANGYTATESDRFVWGNPTVEVGERLTCVTRQEALDKAQPGEPVCLLQDIVNETLSFTNGQNYVLSGRGTKGFRLTAPIKVSTVLNLKDGATIKLVDIFVDGGGDELTTLASLFSIGTNCVLTLGTGTTVRNVKTSNNIAIVAALTADRARLIMEDGALITDCEAMNTGGWGFLVRAGQLEVKVTGEDRPCFEMRGGLITGNRAATTSAASGGYGGMIYIQRGRFEMTGGAITGNSCGTAESGSCAGVQAYEGGDWAGAWISGTARIVGNVGKNPDVFRSNSGKLHLFGDFRGRVGISSGNQGAAQLADVTVEDGATGAWGLFPAATTATSGLVGKFADGGVRWTASTGTVDGEAIASADDALECWSARNTATLDEAGLAALPHVFAGTALGIDGTLTLDFDPIAMRKDARLPIRLLTAQDGAFTGDWTFNLPACDKPGNWEVVPVRENGDIVAYDLAFYPAGAMLIIR